jgi:hypothetical protein
MKKKKFFFLLGLLYIISLQDGAALSVDTFKQHISPKYKKKRAQTKHLLVMMSYIKKIIINE